MHVELNPNIVKKTRSIRKEKPFRSFSFINITDSSGKYLKVLQHMRDIKQAHAEAKKLAQKFPIAFRLEPVVEIMKRDNIHVEKFGGIPNLQWFFSVIECTPKKEVDKYSDACGKNIKHKMKPNFPTVDKFIDKKWPRCKCCNQPMKFIAQLELQDWLIAIHELTLITKTKWSSYSGFGHTYPLTNLYPFYINKYLFFFCDNGHWDEPNSDALCMIEHIRSRVPEEWDESLGPKDMYRFHKGMQEQNDAKIEKGKTCGTHDSPPWTDKEFIVAARKFIRKHKLLRGNRKYDISTPIVKRKVIGYNIRFDLEADHSKMKYDTPESALYDKLNYYNEEYPLFSSKGDFQLFGAPKSQQTEKRYMCQNSHPIVHRMNPLISWNDEEHDLTNQFYGCMKCLWFESNDIIFGKMDTSCT